TRACTARLLCLDLPSLTQTAEAFIAKFVLTKGRVAEWLGGGLQKLVQRFESARDLKSRTSKLSGFFLFHFCYFIYILFRSLSEVIILPYLTTQFSWASREKETHIMGKSFFSEPVVINTFFVQYGIYVVKL